MGDDNRNVTANVTPAVKSGAGEIADFVRHARAVMPVGDQKPGRLVLALDATLSRQPTWDLACRLQGEMFDAVGHAGRLHVQLVYYRGLGECRASRFVADTAALKDLMIRIDCRGGHTQIAKILKHARKENERAKVNALVMIGDAMEENADELADIAGSLGLLGVPVFVFQEGRDMTAERTFKEIARLSKGAWFRFDEGAAAVLAKLLSAVAVFATGGVDALEARGRPEDIVMLGHLRGDSKP